VKVSASRIAALKGPSCNAAIREADTFTIRHVRAIEIGGLYPRVFVLGRA
jgi:hypothetical protein